MAKLSNKDKADSRGFLLDLFWQGGLIKPGDTSIGSSLSNRWTGLTNYGVRGSIKAVCDEVVQRNFDFFNVDAALNQLADCKFFVDPTAFGRVRGARMVKRSADLIAGYIANFCAEQGIYWDDVNTHKTVQEMDQYKKTLLGGAVWEYECFLSQQLNKGNTTTASAASTTGATTNTQAAPTSTRAPRAPKAPGQGPANPYKSLGPQSGKARDLKGNPGDKVYANTKVSFCIVADNAKSASPAYALVKPLNKQGDDGNGTNKVFVSSSHGYADCTCYFDDINDANAFLAQCNAKNWGPDISNLRVMKRASESNGYFIVGTEFGDCAISAKRMNEAAAFDEKHHSVGYTINDIDVYAEAFMRE